MPQWRYCGSTKSPLKGVNGGKAESELPNDEFIMQAEAWKNILVCAEEQRHKKNTVLQWGLVTFLSRVVGT